MSPNTAGAEAYSLMLGTWIASAWKWRSRYAGRPGPWNAVNAGVRATDVLRADPVPLWLDVTDSCFEHPFDLLPSAGPGQHALHGRHDGRSISITLRERRLWAEWDQRAACPCPSTVLLSEQAGSELLSAWN